MYDLRAILKRLKFPISTTLAGSEEKKNLFKGPLRSY